MEANQLRGTGSRRSVGNVVRRNYVRDARGAAIAVARIPKRTTLRRNRVVRAGRDGIIIGGPTTKLIANRAVRNGDLGIAAIRGVIDGGGNAARGNGDPRQCTHIACG